MTKRKTHLLWTPAEDERMRVFHAGGRQVAWISNAMERSRWGTHRRLAFLGLIPKPAPKEHGARIDLPFSQTRKISNAAADELFGLVMFAVRGEFQCFRARDAGGLRVRRPDTLMLSGGSSLAFAAGRTVEEAAAKP